MAHNFRCGLVGLGEQMLSEYLPALERRSIDIEFVCDLRIDKIVLPPRLDSCLKLRSLADVPANTEYPIILTLPHHIYPTAITELIARGCKKIAIEKPPALRVSDYSKVCAEAARYQAAVFVLSKRRFYDSFLALKRELDGWGRLDALSVNISRVFRRSDYGWRADPDLGGKNVLFDLGYHAIDMVFWLLNGPILVKARQGRRIPQPPSIDRASIEILCGDPPLVVDVYTDRISPSPFEQVTAFAPKATAACTPRTLITFTSDAERVWEFSTATAVDRMLLDMFLACQDPLHERSVSLYSEHAFHMASIHQLSGESG